MSVIGVPFYVMEKIDGTVEICSARGRGTTLRIKVPLAQHCVNRSAPAGESSPVAHSTLADQPGETQDGAMQLGLSDSFARIELDKPHYSL